MVAAAVVEVATPVAVPATPPTAPPAVPAVLAAVPIPIVATVNKIIPATYPTPSPILQAKPSDLNGPYAFSSNHLNGAQFVYAYSNPLLTHLAPTKSMTPPHIRFVAYKS